MIDMKRKKKPVIIYTPESPLRRPFELMRSMVLDLMASYRLARRLTIRDISAQYRQTFLGYFWAVFPPLVTSLTFIILNRANIMQMGAIEIPYPVFVITGTVFWQLFVDALNAPLKVLTVNRTLLSKINFPKEALILSAIGQTLFSFFIKLVLLTLVLIFFQIPIKWTTIFIVLPVSGLLLIGLLFGILLIPIGMLYQDIQQGLIISTSALIFFTPVLFIPPTGGVLNLMISINPISPLFLSIRRLLFNGDLQYFNTSILVLAVTLALLGIGWIIYRVALPILIERMDA